ncbi:MAG TPA: GNAT family N-acetyltransferase [Anaeromyxobacteraceae bacterium]|nr:GNAT family N-acetyltransferase [Anaeromyxobacteraceae bacterium]
MGQLGRLVELSAADATALQALFGRCEAFFRLVHGAPPRPDEAERFLRAEGAAGTVFGLLDDEGRLVGAVDLTPDQPEPGEWHLGTMVIEPSIRGVGLGADFHAKVLRYARGRGARAVQLRVAGENPGAVRFWARAGYEEVGRGTAEDGRAVVRMRLVL